MRSRKYIPLLNTYTTKIPQLIDNCEFLVPKKIYLETSKNLKLVIQSKFFIEFLFDRQNL